MCTVIAAIDVVEGWPLLIAAMRDEAVGRRWRPPRRHWLDRWPQVVGGKDIVGGGTWFAVNPKTGSVAFVVNRRERTEIRSRRSRGELPLLALGSAGDLEAALNSVGLQQFDGFLLGHGTAAGLTIWDWDTRVLRQHRLTVGFHGMCYRGVAADHPRLRRFVPRFATVLPPCPSPGLPSERAWGAWLNLLAGDGLEPQDPVAIRWRRNVDGVPWTSQSAACVAIGPAGLRFDFTATPEDATAWTTVVDPAVT